MDRKKTILIALAINTGLLFILFISALVRPEIVEEKTPKFAKKEEPILQYNEDLFVEKIPEVKEEPIFHSLPPLAIEEKKETVETLPKNPCGVKPIAEEVSFPEVIVKRGDNLEKIAKAHKTTVNEIVKLNHLPSTLLKIGQVLKIPEGVHSSKKADPRYYTIKVGENPWAIAHKHHMKVQDLLKLNGLNEEKARKLKPGDRLRVQ